MKAALELAWIYQRCGVPFALEYPASSFVWQAPEVKWLLAQPGVDMVIVDICYWGTPWRKRTAVVFGKLRLGRTSQPQPTQVHWGWEWLGL